MPVIQQQNSAIIEQMIVTLQGAYGVGGRCPGAEDDIAKDANCHLWLLPVPLVPQSK